MTKLVLLLGSNIDDKKQNLLSAIDEINKQIGEVVKRSQVYKTQAWGNTEQDDFYNQCIIVETQMPAEDILQHCLAIEQQFGRTRSDLRYQPRTIDIDILFYDDLVTDSPNLTIPHPQMSSRRFTLAPLAEILPGFVHPVENKTMLELLEECPDPLNCEALATL